MERILKTDVKIGTRGSKLAIIQAEMVKKLLLEKDSMLKVDIIIIKTKGDKILDSPLSKIGDKGLFTKELETALLTNRIDLAVHSLKDLPTELPEGISLGGVLKREDVRDAFISKDGKLLSEMPRGSVIGTSSLRRRSQLLRLGKGFQIIDIRGNVDTRLSKLESGYCDGTILACSGMIRSGLEYKITEKLSPNIMMPAISQGIIGIEINENNSSIKELLLKINDFETALMAKAERAFLNTLEGGCQTPVGCYSVIDGNNFRFRALVSDLDGQKVITADNTGPLEDAVEIALRTASEILARGGNSIMADIRNELGENYEA
jgi:hydroxymethylbilane synthase